MHGSAFAELVFMKKGNNLTFFTNPEAAVHKAQIASRVLYDDDYTAVNTEDILAALSEDPRLKVVTESELLSTPISKLAVQAKLISSNCKSSGLAICLVFTNLVCSLLAAAKRIVDAKGLYVNNKRVENYLEKVSKEELLDGRCVVVRCGSQKQLVFVASSS